MATGDAATTSNESLTRIALGLAVASVLVMIVLATIDHDGAGWILQPILGIAAAVVAWRAGGLSPRNNSLAFGALVVGVVMTLIFLAYVIADA